MTLYGSELTLGEARRIYFDINNFKNGGYDEKWVKMKIGPFPFAFPNTKGRLRAVKLHDLHHVLTEYPTTWRGETEIGAWEVATGIHRHYEGWYLDLMAFAIGLVINPRGVYRSFMRGRQSANLYFMEFSEELLTRNVGAVRRELRLDHPPKPPSTKDRLSFLAWAAVSVVIYLGTVAAFLAPLVLLVGVVLFWKLK